MIATHLYIQRKIKDFFYLTDDVKLQLSSVDQDEAGIFTTRAGNTTYQALSQKFKGDCPMGMLSGLNRVITKTFVKESIDTLKGNRSLRTYRSAIPMPVRAGDIRNFTRLPDGNYSFLVYGLSFRTYFGRDRSENRINFDRVMAGEYALCDSSISVEKGKEGKMNRLVYNASFEIETKNWKLDVENFCYIELHNRFPIRGWIGKFEFTIGTKREFLYRRLAIQGKRKRLQAECRFNKSGKGRGKKMEAIDYFEGKERDYVVSRIHKYTVRVIQYCLEKKCGRLVVLRDKKGENPSLPDKQKFLIRNMNYGGALTS